MGQVVSHLAGYHEEEDAEGKVVGHLGPTAGTAPATPAEWATALPSPAVRSAPAYPAAPIMTSAASPAGLAPTAVAGVPVEPTPVQVAAMCPLHPGFHPLRTWDGCSMKMKGMKRTQGTLHAFPTSICFHPLRSSSVTHIDLSGVEDVRLKGHSGLRLSTPLGKCQLGGMAEDVQRDLHATLNSLWMNTRGQTAALPRTPSTTSSSQVRTRAPLTRESSEQRQLAAIAELEQQYGMRAHPTLPDSMSALFLHARQTTDMLLAHGLTPNAPSTLNKTDTMLPVSLASFWTAFASPRYQDWPTVFMPTGRWRAQVGEWKTDGISIFREVQFTPKPSRNSGLDDALYSSIATIQRACLVVNRKNLEARIHVVATSMMDGMEYPKAKDWFELVDISRDRGFPMLEILEYRWREEAPTPLV